MLRSFNLSTVNKLLVCHICLHSNCKEERGRRRGSPWEKRRKQGEAHQLTFAVLKQQNQDPWNFDNVEHKRITQRIREMIALNSQPFSIVEDRGFLRLLAHVSPWFKEVFFR